MYITFNCQAILIICKRSFFLIFCLNHKNVFLTPNHSVAYNFLHKEANKNKKFKLALTMEVVYVVSMEMLDY